MPNPLAPNGRPRPERPWVHDFLDAVCAFPRGASDDDVDALSQLLAWRRGSGDEMLQFMKEILQQDRERAALGSP